MSDSCAGNIAGPQFVYPRESPRYATATKAMLISYSIKTACHVLLGVYMWSVNKRRDRAANGQAVDEARGAEAGMRDLTEVSHIIWAQRALQQEADAMYVAVREPRLPLRLVKCRDNQFGVSREYRIRCRA